MESSNLGGGPTTTQTALVKVASDFRIKTNSKKLSVFMLLDLTAAIKTAEDEILLDELHK